MADLATIQQEFMSMLLDNDRSIEDRVIKQGALSKGQRIDIYRSGYIARLRSVIDTDHEILGLYLGDDLFEVMVEDYINSCPSEFWTLRFYAENLPDFMQQHPTFSEYPILAEIARFERILLHAFDAGDNEPISPALLQQIPPQSWPEMRFTLHPSLHFFQAKWNSVESWQQLKNGDAPPSPEENEECNVWAVWRNPDKLTEYKFIGTPEWQLLKAANEQQPFAQICELAADFFPVAIVAETLYGKILEWIQSGWLVDVSWSESIQQDS